MLKLQGKWGGWDSKPKRKWGENPKNPWGKGGPKTLRGMGVCVL